MRLHLAVDLPDRCRAWNRAGSKPAKKQRHPQRLFGLWLDGVLEGDPVVAV